MLGWVLTQKENEHQKFPGALPTALIRAACATDTAIVAKGIKTDGNEQPSSS